MKLIKYPTVKDIIKTNQRVLFEIKIRKANRHQLLVGPTILQKILASVKRTSGNIYDKAATLLSELVRRHPFASGNRRTAFAAAMEFLLVNGVESPLLRKKKSERVLIGVRESYYGKKEIVRWLKTGEIRAFKR